jgi:hypothetical protein
VKTFQVTSLPKGMQGKKIQVATVKRDGGAQAETVYKEGYRLRLNSREARKLRRAKVELMSV